MTSYRNNGRINHKNTEKYRKHEEKLQRGDIKVAGDESHWKIQNRGAKYVRWKNERKIET